MDKNRRLLLLMLFRFRSLCRVERSVFPAKPPYWKTALRTSGYTRAFTAGLETWRDTRLQMHMWSHVNEVRLSQSFQSLHSRSASWSWSCLHSKHGLILKLNNPVASTKIANPTKGDAGCKPWRFIWHPTSTKNYIAPASLSPGILSGISPGYQPSCSMNHSMIALQTASPTKGNEPSTSQVVPINI